MTRRGEGLQGLTREQMARRVAADLEDGWVVNIGVGMPTTVLPHVPQERDVVFYSENGIIGMRSETDGEDAADDDMRSAGRGAVRLIPGGAFVDHADSFALARNGRLDVTILGAFQVAGNGDFANWRLPGAKTGNIGGAMDLAVGARRVFLMMAHLSKDGAPKLVETLSYAATARRVVTKIFTDLAVLAIEPGGFILEEVAPGVDVDDVRAATAAPLQVPETPRTIAA